MFHNIPPEMRERMAFLEAVDSRDRQDGTPRRDRLRQVPPETGKFLAILAAGAPAGRVVEVGTSAGYSSLWLALACRERGDRLTTYEVLETKATLARDTFKTAGVEDTVEFVYGNALEHLTEANDIAFCFMDAEKEIYEAVYDLVIPRLVPGGLFAADNALSHTENLAPFLERVQQDSRVDSVVVPIGKGVLVCRKTGK